MCAPKKEKNARMKKTRSYVVGGREREEKKEVNLQSRENVSANSAERKKKKKKKSLAKRAT